MNGAEVVAAALRHHPALLRSLVHQLAGVELPGPLALLPDAPLPTFRLASGAWFSVAVLDSSSDEERGGWPMALTLLAESTGVDGDLIVLTSSKNTGRWARRTQRREGLLGTRLSLVPLVLHVGLDEAEALLRGPSAHAALVAAWAVHRKDGPRSRAVAAEAARRLDGIPPAERSWWLHATLQLLNRAQLAHIQAMSDDLPRSEAFSQFCSAIESQAEARGKAGSVLRFLDLRRIPLSPEQRGYIASCADLPTADRWVESVFAAASKGAMLEAIFSPNAPPIPSAAELPELPDTDPVTPEPPPLTPDPPEATEPDETSPAPEAEESAQA